MAYVYVLDKDGGPLMPTARCGKVRRMLDDGLAVAVSAKPFVIRLTYEPATHVTQDVYAGIDAGRTNIGLAAVREDGQCLYRAHVETKNKQVPKHMADRAEHRLASRRGERLRRQRRARRHGTEFMDFKATAMGVRPVGKMRKGHFTPTRRRCLPGYGEDGYITLCGITNSEARFNNRARPEGWLTPTATQLLRTHVSTLSLIQKILPVTDVCLEVNRFAFMALGDPGIWKHGADFQNGALKGYDGVNAAVDAMQGGKCLLCGGPIECHHHVLPRHEYGSGTFANIVGLCGECHTKVHTDAAAGAKLDTLHGRRNKKYGALSVLNQAMPYLTRELAARFPGRAGITAGYETMLTREALGLDKDHDLDAYCIAMQGIMDTTGVASHMSLWLPETYEVLQFRRHDRALINNRRERTYKYEGTVIAKNRHGRAEQKSPSLEDWFNEQAALYGIKAAERMRSNVQAVSSRRYYNDPERVMPGAAFLYEGRRYVLSGQISNGQYYRACGCGDRNFPSVKCMVVRRNAGLVYV